MIRSGRPPLRAALRRLAAAGLAVVTAATMSGCTIIQHLEQAGATGGEAGLSDIPENVRSYYEQHLAWSDCGQGRECATASAPMNWDDPAAGDVELALVRIPATSGKPQGSLFTNPGGPGASGYDMVYQYGEDSFSADLRKDFDIVGWDPRGVGRSSAVECYDDAGMDEFFYGVPTPAPKTDEEKIEAARQASKDFADACAANTGPLLEFVDTISTVHDLDLLRALVGDPKLNYFGFSYGTDIGAHYADLFPTHVGRMVLDGATDPALSSFEVVLAQQTGFANATKAYLEDCLGSKSCPFTGSVDDAIAQINALMQRVDDKLPKASDGRVLTSSVIDTAINAALYSESSWQYLTEAFTDYLRRSDPSGFFFLSDFYYDRDANGHYTSNMFEAFIAINCLDYPVETDPAVIREENRQIAEASPIGVPGPQDLGDTTCEQWPYQSRVTPHAVRGAGAPPILVVGTTGDPATPLAWAEAVSQQLESGVLLTYRGEGHIAYDEGDPCVVGDVDHYLLTGEPPADGTVC